MATINGYTAEKMQEINDTTIIDGDVVGDNLILHPRNSPDIDAGNVRGPKGDKGDQGLQGNTGAQGPQGIQGNTGDVGEMVAHSELSTNPWGTTEQPIIAFTVPSGFKIGDRLKLLSFGSFAHPDPVNTYTGCVTLRLKIAGSISGVFANIYVPAMPNGQRYGFEMDWLFFQQDASYAVVKGKFYYPQAPNLTVDNSGGDVSTPGYQGWDGLVISTPVVLLAGKQVTVTYQGSQPYVNLRIRGFHVEHHHIKSA